MGAAWIDPIRWLIARVRIEVCCSGRKSNWVFPDEPLEGRAIKPRTIVVEPRTVIFATGELVRVAIGGAAYGRRAEGLIGVLGAERASSVGERAG